MTALRSTDCRCAVAGAAVAGVGAAGGGDPPGAAGVAVVAGVAGAAGAAGVAGGAGVVAAGGADVVAAGEVGGPSDGSPSCRWCDAWREEEDQRMVRAVMESFRAEETSGKE